MLQYIYHNVLSKLKQKKELVNLIGSKKFRERLLSCFFLVSILIFSLSQFYITLKPYSLRQLPPEVDDTYSYVNKAAQIKYNCFNQNSVALNDLKLQLGNFHTNNNKLNDIRFRQYHRLFIIYHPLHSFVLYFINSLGFSWEYSYFILAVFGIFLLTVSISLWLYSVFGYSGSIITLIYFTFYIFSGQGLAYIVPSNITLGIAIFSWFYLSYSKNPKFFIVFFLIFLMSNFHSVGKLYCILTFILYIGLIKMGLRQIVIKSIIFIGYFIILFIFPYFIKSPDFKISTGNYPVDFNYWGAVFTNLQIFRSDFQISKYHLILLTFSIAILLFNKFSRRKIYIFLGAFTGLLFISLLSVLPDYPGEVTRRVSIPIAIFLYGVFFTASVKILDLYVKSIMIEKNSTENQFNLTIFNSLIITALFSIWFFPKFDNLIRNRYTTAQQHVGNMVERHQYQINHTQPDILLALIKENDVVWYSDEISLYYFISNGLLNNHSVFIPGLVDDEQNAYLALPNKHYYVSISPMESFPLNKVIFTNQDTIQIKITSDSTNLLILNSFNSFSGKLLLNDTCVFINLIKGENVIKLPKDYKNINLISSNAQASELLGIKFNTTDSLLWEWNKEFTIEQKGKNQVNYKAKFEQYKIFNSKVEVINDKGLLVLGKFEPN